MEPDELSLVENDDEDENTFFTSSFSSQESLIDSLLTMTPLSQLNSAYNEPKRNVISKSTSGNNDNFAKKITRMQRTQSMKNSNNSKILSLRTSLDGMNDSPLNYFDDEDFSFPTLGSAIDKIQFESSEESNSEFELGMTDLESDVLSEGCFTEFQSDSRPAYLRPSKVKYVKLSSNFSPLSSKEWSAYCLWVKQVAKSSLYESDEFGAPPSLRQIFFSHFLRLEIPTIDITAKNLGTDADWKKKSRLTFPNVVSYIQVPLDDQFSSTWWCDDSHPPASTSNGFSYICHLRQTILEERKKSKRERRIEAKLNFSKMLLNNDTITIFDSQDPKMARERNHHINWAIKWIISTRKKVPHKLRLACSRLLVSLVYPEEKYEGLVNKIWESGAVYSILRYAKKGEISIHHRIQVDQIKLGNLIDRGSTGKVHFGVWNNDEIAVKISSSSNVSFKIEDFRFEVAIMCLLRHPNIALCLAANLDGPKYALVTSFQSKGSLRSILLNSEEDISWKTRIQILYHIALGMEYLHRNKIIHRDLKSPNIIVGIDWSVKITDFGSSCILGYQHHDKGLLIGTAEWMAPEMIEGGSYNEKVDVYSFGIVLFEVIAREIPFREKKTWQIPEFVLSKARPELPSDCPYKTLKELTISSWHHSPRKRPSFAMIKDKLESLYLKVCRGDGDSSTHLSSEPSLSPSDRIKICKSHNSHSKLMVTESMRTKYRVRSVSSSKKVNI